MMRSQKPVHESRASGSEVVVTVDRRALIVLGLVAAFALAVGAGVWMTRRAAQPAAAPASGEPVAQATAGAPAGAGETIDDASARATAAALGLDPRYVNIVGDSVEHVVTTADPSGASAAAPVGTVDPYASAKAGITPVSTLHAELLEDPSVIPVEIPQDPTSQAAMAASYKNAEVLSNVVDPNVTNADYAPLRLETVSRTLDGPRLALSDLNLTNTYNFGLVLMTERVSHAFTAKNVGTDALVVSRIYTGCGCTATTVAGKVIPPDGILAESLTLAPGESIEFVVEFDAAQENRAGATSKYVQIFTNDPTNVRFDDADPNSHETRFRLVVEPQWASSTPTP